MRFFIEMFYLACIVIHQKLVGSHEVASYSTEQKMELTFTVDSLDYIFKSEQYLYISKASGILGRTRREYVYKVRLLVDTESKGTLENTSGVYFSQCPSFLRKTSYPHRLAINTHFKRVVLGAGFIHKSNNNIHV